MSFFVIPTDRDDCMDAGGRVTQDAVTEGSYMLDIYAAINRKISPSGRNDKLFRGSLISMWQNRSGLLQINHSQIRSKLQNDPRHHIAVF